MRSLHLRLFAILFLLTSVMVPCVTATAQTTKGPVVGYAQSFGITQPLRNIQPSGPAATGSSGNRIIPIRKFSQPKRSALKPVNPIAQAFVPASLMPSPSLVFEGLSAADNEVAFGFASAPPDTVGDVGPNHFVQQVNTLFRVFDKATGAALSVPLKLSDLFKSAGLPGACANTDQGDGIVLYDHLADRWLITQFAFETDAVGNILAPAYEAIAVSQSGDPLGSYFVYCFQMPNGALNDYPKFGVWPDAYYMSDNQFDLSSFAFLGAGAFAFDRAKLLAGDPLVSFIYFDLGGIDPNLGGGLPSDLDGPPPPVGTPNRFLFLDEPAGLRIFEFHADFANTNNASFTELAESPVAVEPFDTAVSGILQPDTTTTLEPISDRLMARLQYRNFGSHESLVVNHTVNADGAGRAGIRYYELRRNLPGGFFDVNEQATFSPDQHSRWMGSAAMDGSGNLVVGYSISSGTMYPSIRYAGRRPSDPPGGLFQGEAVLFNGTGSQTDGLDRWGDYSALSVDPVDDCTFWYTTEYIATTGSFNWATKIGRFRFADCTGGLPILSFNSAIVTGGNGNGLLDANECINLSVVLTNRSGVSETNSVTASLTAVTPGVVVHTPEAYYFGIPAGQSGANVNPIAISTSKNLPCGKPIDFLLTVKSAEAGTYTVPFQLPVAVVNTNAAVRFDNSTVTSIPDLGTAESSVAVSDLTGLVVGVKVGMFVTHTFDADLTVTLVAPDGSEVELSRHHGGGGDNYGSGCTDLSYTIFDDNATNAISSGTASFVGSFRPDHPLSGFHGINPNGEWKLRVSDDAALDTGTIRCWSLTLTTGNCVSGNGTCFPLPEVCLSANNLDFGSRAIGSVSDPKALTLTNCGNAAVTITSVQIAGANASDFTIVSDSCNGSSLAAGGSCSVTLVYSPSTVGATDARLIFEDSAPTSPQVIGLLGQGINCSLISIQPQILATQYVGIAYSAQLTAAGSIAPVRFFRSAGQYPTGLTMNIDGRISGTPTTLGLFSFKIQAEDSSGCLAERTYSVQVYCPTITAQPNNLPLGQIGTAYQAQIVPVGGVAPYSFAQTGGSFPAGLSISSDGVISGIPQSGSSVFTITITDANGCRGQQSFLITLADPPPAIFVGPDSLSPAAKGASYDQQLTATGGTAPHTFAVSSGALPAGLSLSSAGKMAGTPSVAGNASFTVTAADAAGQTGSRSYTLSVKKAATDLGVVLAQSAATVQEGDEVVYTITVTNYGASPATNVRLTGLSNAQFGDLAVGASASIAVNVTASGVGAQTRSVGVTSDEADFNQVNNSGSIETVVTARPPSSAVQFRAASYLVDAGASAAVIVIVRDGNLNVAGNVGFASVDGSARAGVDYAATSGTVGFAVGEKTRTIAIPLLRSGSAGSRTFTVALRNPSSGIALGSQTQAAVTIVKGSAPNSFTVGATRLRLLGAGRMTVSSSANKVDEIHLQGTDWRSSLVITKELSGATVRVDGVLGSLRAGSLEGVRVVADGIGTVRVGSMKNSWLAAGYVPTNENEPMGGGVFIGNGTVKAVKATIMGSSTIAAAQIGAVRIGNIVTDNSGHAFGVMARDSIGSVKVSAPKFVWNPSGTADQAAGDFHVKRELE